jgi:hypothetical protein
MINKSKVIFKKIELFVLIWGFMLVCSSDGQDAVNLLFNNFNDVSLWQLNGRAKVVTNSWNERVIRLAEHGTNITTSAFLKNAIKLKTSSNPNSSFGAYFAFRISHPVSTGGEGMTFVMHTRGSYALQPERHVNPSTTGYGLGILDLNPSVAVEIDINKNYQCNDKDNNHIGIDLHGNLNSRKSLYYHTSFTNNNLFHTWIDYDGIKKIFEVRIANNNSKPEKPFITDTIDVAKELQSDNIYVGFTGATGDLYCNEDLAAFRFVNKFIPYSVKLETFLEPDTVAAVAEPARVIANVIDNHSNVMGDLSKNVKWKILSSGGNTSSILNKIIGDSILVTPELAFSTIVLEASLDVDNYHLKDTVKIHVGAGKPYQIVIEKNAIINDTLRMRKAQPIDSIILSSKEIFRDIYAVLRDKTGAFCGFADLKTMEWIALDRDVIKVTPESGTNYHGILQRVGRNGKTTVLARMTNVKSDSLHVTLLSDREMKLYYLNSEVSTINDKMSTLRIQFDPGIAVDGSLSMLVTTVNGSVRDSEELELVNDKFYWTRTFENEIKKIPVVNDGVVQHQLIDSLKFTFKNNRNSSDVFSVAYPFFPEVLIGFKSASCYDLDADGFIDRIIIKSTGNIKPADLSAFEEKVIFPSFREYTIKSSSSANESIILDVKENRSGNPITSIMYDEVLLIQDARLPSGDFIQGEKLQLIDKVAPVIIKAVIYQSDTDEIEAVFSEYVITNALNSPFMIQNGIGGSADFKVVSDGVNGNVVRRRILNTDFVVDKSDMISLDKTDMISDSLDNAQENIGNRKVPVEIKRGPVSFVDASYFDRDADGFIDSVKLGYSGKILENDLSKIIFALKLPSYRNFEIVKTKIKNNYLEIIVKENRHGSPKTNVDSDEMILVESLELDGNGSLTAGSLKINDFVAPVLIYAKLKISSEDSLEIGYSEPVVLQIYNKSIVFKNNAISEIFFEFKDVNKLMGDQMMFELENALNVENYTSSDSVFLNKYAEIADYSSNRQKNPLNKRVPLTVIKSKIPYQVLIRTINNPSNGKKMSIVAIVNMGGNKKINFNGQVSIYDALKRPVIENKKMTITNRTLTYDWDCTNSKQKKVETGTYLSFIKITDDLGYVSTFREFLGVIKK